MTPSEKMLARLTAMGVPIPDGAVIRRTYAGRLQRRAGAWSWYVDPEPRIPGAGLGLGGFEPLGELLRVDWLVVVPGTGDTATVDVWTPPGKHERFLYEEGPKL